jgi:putative addiction module component (TIGR02574 family)
MSKLAELTESALAMPVPERIRLAQNLWASVEDAELDGLSDAEWDAEIRRRLQDPPDETWKSHEEVMAEARQKFGWKK